MAVNRVSVICQSSSRTREVLCLPVYSTGVSLGVDSQPSGRDTQRGTRRRRCHVLPGTLPSWHRLCPAAWRLSAPCSLGLSRISQQRLCLVGLWVWDCWGPVGRAHHWGCCLPLPLCPSGHAVDLPFHHAAPAMTCCLATGPKAQAQ